MNKQQIDLVEISRLRNSSLFLTFPADSRGNTEFIITITRINNMMYLRWLDINILEGDSIDEYDKLTKEYYSYLDSIRPFITQSVYNYAIADWHYDSTIHYSPHDAILKKIDMVDNGRKGLNLNMVLISAYQDYELEFIYKNVLSYSINCVPHINKVYDKSVSVHGEFLWDSIEYDKKNNLTNHHIVFSSDSKIIVSCESFDFIYRNLNSAVNDLD